MEPTTDLSNRHAQNPTRSLFEPLVSTDRIPLVIPSPLGDRLCYPIAPRLPLDHVTTKVTCLNHGGRETAILGISRDPVTAASLLRSYITALGEDAEIVNTQLPAEELWQLNEDMEHPTDKIRISADGRMILAGCDVYVITEHAVNVRLKDTGTHF